jgi:hypothetical protein
MPFLQLRGKVRLAPRNTDGTPGKWWDPGCPAAFNIALSEETFEIIEKCSGVDGVALRGVRSQGAEVSLNLYEDSDKNLMLALQAEAVAAQTPVAVVDEVLSTTGLATGELLRVGGADGHQNIAISAITDGGGALVEDTDYRLHEASGFIEALVDLTGTIEVSYTYDDMAKLAMFKAGSKEYYLAFDGRNKADNFNPRVLELFRVRFGPLANFDVLPDEVSVLELTGSALIDSTRATDDPLGQFGWVSAAV